MAVDTDTIRCLRCLRLLPRWCASIVATPIPHVNNGLPCRGPYERWGWRRIDECRVWQNKNLNALELS